MKKTVSPSRLSGQVFVPGSKSIFQRVIAASLLSEEATVIHHPYFCEDTKYALQVAIDLGAKVIDVQDGFIKIQGGLKQPTEPIHFGESGLASRMFTSIAALNSEAVNLVGSGSLKKRPMNAIQDVLNNQGVDIQPMNGHLPFSVAGPLTGGEFTIDGSMSSQFLTGLLMALPKCKEDSVVNVTNLKSKPYVDLTLEILDHFGVEIWHKNYETFNIKGNQSYSAEEVTVEGDWSSAASLLVAGAVAGDQFYELVGMDNRFTQADSVITGVLLFSGVKLMQDQGNLKVNAGKIRGFEFDATECPDLFPVLAALGVFAEKSSKIKGISRLEHKESNRALTVQSEFAKLGIKIDLEGDYMIIHPGQVKSGTISSCGDHRIAMAGTILGLGGAPVTIEEAEAVSKSYPDFFEDLKEMGAKIS